ncbi:MAG: TrmH family RNA methyltransferase, partial [Patescibacteria group bacterium]|nr:TrmH family RNA methyltransferase [Patescibacteria group bacterium]
MKPKKTSDRLSKSKGMEEIIVVLHNIRSLHNVGSIFRTADGAGIKKIYVCGITPTPLDRFNKLIPQFAKVALGAEKNIEWVKLKSTVSAIKDLKKQGFKIIAIEQSKKSIPYFKYQDKNKKIALVLGNEIKGVPQSILREVDKILEIPMHGKKESLNVTIAFGIVICRLLYPSPFKDKSLRNQKS